MAKHPLEAVDYRLVKFWLDQAQDYQISSEFHEPIHKALVIPHYDDNERPLPTLVVLAGGEQSGKALALSTPIPTPSGWKVLGDIHPGDYVFDENGLPCRVLAESRIWTDRPCYRVTFDDGESIIADEMHEWLTETSAARKSRRRMTGTQRSNVENIKTTKDISMTLRARIGHRAEHSNHSITMHKPLQYQEQELLVDPYVLGAWLGDGTSASGGFTNADQGVLEEIGHQGYRLSSHKAKYHYNILGLGRMLRQMGLLNNKHIPQPYLQGSVEQRLDLLQGLMDTDGCCGNDGACEFDNTNVNIIRGIDELLTSLGIKHQIRAKTARLYGKDCGIVYSVSFVSLLPVFKLSRKLLRQIRSQVRDERRRKYITSVVGVASVATKCIEVDSDAHLYLAGRGMIPTHNSTACGAHVFGMHWRDKLVWIVGERYEDTRKEFEYLVQDGDAVGATKQVWTSQSPSPSRALFQTGLRVRTLSSSDASTLQGESPDGILMVEAGRQSYQAFKTLWTRAMHRSAWLLVSGTFEQYKGRWFPDLWKACQGENEYHGVSLSLPTYANPILYPEGARDPKVLAARATMTEEEFAERFLGEPRSPVGVVFPEFRRSLHVKNIVYTPGYPVELWVDPGYQPSAYAVLFVQVINDQIRVLDELYLRQVVNREVVDMVLNSPLTQFVEKIVIDVAAQAHAGAQDPAAEAWRAGFRGRGVGIRSKYVKVVDGVKRTHDKLLMNPMTNEPFMVFSPKCENTIDEFEEGYRRHTRNDGTEVQGTPIDANNHSVKAIAYGIIDHFGMGDAPRLANVVPVRRKMAYDRGIERFQPRRGGYRW